MITPPEVIPYSWTEASARFSGRQGYRIGVMLSGNPFKGPLAICWTEGWNYAKANDPFPIVKRVSYAEERPDRPVRRSTTRQSRPFSNANTFTNRDRG